MTLSSRCTRSGDRGLDEDICNVVVVNYVVVVGTCMSYCKSYYRLYVQPYGSVERARPSVRVYQDRVRHRTLLLCSQSQQH